MWATKILPIGKSGINKNRVIEPLGRYARLDRIREGPSEEDIFGLRSEWQKTGNCGKISGKCIPGTKKGMCKWSEDKPPFAYDEIKEGQRTMCVGTGNENEVK